MKQYRILSLEARDIYDAETSNGLDNGYLLPAKKDNNYYKLFGNILDDSLDLQELENRYASRNTHFSFDDDKGNLYTLAIINLTFKRTYKKDNKTIFTTRDLRARYYNSGFRCQGKRYIRYKRSSGSSREGKCLFIREDFFAHMKTWTECALDSSNGDLSSWEAYKALSLSAIKGRVTIPLNGILLVDDKDSVFFDKVVSVSEIEGGLVDAEIKDNYIKNKIWDGEALLDESVFNNSQFSSKHMLLLRNKFFKTCAFRTKLQKWFRDNNITLRDLNGKTTAKDISDIVMVTTPSSLKYCKFVNKLGEPSLEDFKSWLAHITPEFGVVKYDKPTKYFGGDMVQSSYQLLNTLQLSADDVVNMLTKSKDYLSLLRDDIDVLRYHFSTAFTGDNTETKNKIRDGMLRKSDIIFRLLNINHNFADTELFHNFINELVENFKSTLKGGNILFSGTYATIFGNGPELLKYCIRKYDETSHYLAKGEIRCLKFANNKKLLCARSPHITMGNLYVVTNNMTDNAIWDYFDLGEEIVCVNAIKENIQHRLNGCDYDSDAMLITDDELLVSRASMNYDKFLVPVSDIKEEIGNKKERDLVKLDIETSNNKIGEIVNFSQYLNSLLWDKLNKKETFENIIEIYKDVCKLAVLSGVEIDRAKRSFGVSTEKVLNQLKDKYKQDFQKPQFFEQIDKENKKRFGVKDKDNAKYKSYDTCMDYIYNTVSSMFDFRANKPTSIEYKPISSLFNKTQNITSSDEYQVNAIIKYIESINNEIASYREKLSVVDDDGKAIIYSNINQLREDTKIELSKRITNEAILLATIKRLEKNKASDWRCYYALFEDANEYFYKIIKENRESKYDLIKDACGDIRLYDISYVKKLWKND